MEASNNKTVMYLSRRCAEMIRLLKLKFGQDIVDDVVRSTIPRINEISFDRCSITGERSVHYLRISEEARYLFYEAHLRFKSKIRVGDFLEGLINFYVEKELNDLDRELFDVFVRSLRIEE